MEQDETKVESLELWLSKKPYWEQFVWKQNLEKDFLTEEDIHKAYEYLSEHLELIEPLKEKKPGISFKNEIMATSESTEIYDQIKILEVKDFVNVNAISEDCSLKLGSNLTLIYGGNGSGKSGIGRLLCNACFSRGERDVLPNAHANESGDAEATFVMDQGEDTPKEIKYTIGDDIDALKRFSVFDSESVLIHLDESNQVNFTPAQIKIFDKVADTISILEEMLLNEKNIKRKDNPFDSMFLYDSSTATANFCKNLSPQTKDVDFLKHANFDKYVDGEAMKYIQKLIIEKQKLDVTK